VDDAVRCGGAAVQAVEVVEGAAVHVRAGRRQCCAGGVRAGEADGLMPCVEEFADNRRPDESRCTSDEYTHSEVLFGGRSRVSAPHCALARSPSRVVLTGPPWAIAASYYVRLEQGRDTHPSTLVLDALARALQLDEHATAHLHQLAAPAPRRTRRRRAEKVSAQIDGLLRSLERTTPAYVTGRLTNVLAANELATAVLPLVVPGNDFVRAVFLDPVARELYDDIEGRQAAAVAGLRAFVGSDVEDPELIELVGELSVKSAEFRRLWSRHDVRPMHGALPRLGIRHPQLGPIDLYHQKLEIPDTGQMLGLLYAEPGSKSEQAVAMLAATLGEPNTAAQSII
jgi:MmyB-like transcription regulator ligand binding domain/Helix-turn-helix domain